MQGLLLFLLIAFALIGLAALVILGIGVGGIILLVRSSQTGALQSRILLAVIGILLLIPAVLVTCWATNLYLTEHSRAERSLVALAKSGDTAGIRRRLEKGESPDANAYSFFKGNYFSDAVTADLEPLFYALQTHQLEAAKVLLEAGAARRPMYLIYCYDWEDAEAFALLLESGADPDTPVTFYDRATGQETVSYDGQTAREYLQSLAEKGVGRANPDQMSDGTRRIFAMLDIEIPTETD